VVTSPADAQQANELAARLAGGPDKDVLSRQAAAPRLGRHRGSALGLNDLEGERADAARDARLVTGQ